MWSGACLCRKRVGDDLLSHNVSVAVPSALKSLTSEFGMGSGGPSSPSSPTQPFARGLRRLDLDLARLCQVNDQLNVQGIPDAGCIFAYRKQARPCVQLGTIACEENAPCCNFEIEATRSISTLRLHMLPCLHLAPIHVLVLDGSLGV